MTWSYRDRLSDAGYAELAYWGHQDALCVLVGCRGEGPKLRDGCPNCGGGPYHRACLPLHQRWCHLTVNGKAILHGVVVARQIERPE